jgi:multidrug efflux system membrane fusion protein
MTVQSQDVAQRQHGRPRTAPAPSPTPEHPAPQQRPPAAHKSRRRWVTIIVIAVLALVALIWWLSSRGASSETANRAAAGEGRTIPVIAAAARLGDIPIYLRGLGTVTPLATVTVRTQVDGEIMEIRFVEGQTVQKGELLIQIDPRPFQVQLTQAEGQLAKDEALLKNAQLDLERDKLAKDAISQQQLDTQIALVEQDAAAIKVDQGQIDAVKLNLIYSRITAPVSGKIGLRLVDLGNVVHTTDTNGLAVITQLQPITVVFSLNQDDIPQIIKSSANGLTPQVDAYDRDMTAKLATGTLSALDSQVNPSSGTVLLKATFDNKDNALFPQQFVNAQLLVDTQRGKIIVPVAAVQHGPDGDFVWVIKPDSTVQVQSIETGTVQADQAAIESGLAAGDKVVVDGFDKLVPGSHVSVKQQPTTSSASSGSAPTTQRSHHRGAATQTAEGNQLNSGPMGRSGSGSSSGASSRGGE